MENKISISEQCLTKEEILNYKSGKLNSEEQRRVELHLIDCPLCSDAVEGSVYASNAEIDAKINRIKIVVGQRSGGRANLTKLISSAAAVLLLVSASLFYLLNKPLNERLYAEYFDTYPDVTMHKRGTGNSDLLWAMKFYNQKDYREAVKAFEKVVSKEQKDTIDFYKAVSLMKINKPEKAYTVFSNLTESPESQFYFDALWYSALCKLKLEDYQSAELLLRRIHESDDYDAKARSLLEDIGALN